MTRFFAVAALFLVLAGCATAGPTEPFTPAAAAPEGHANLYIYRHRAPPYIYRAEVHVDDRLVVKLPEGSYSVFPLSQGTHNIRVESFDWPDVSFTVKVEDTSDIFIRFTGGAENIGGGTLELAAEAYVMDEAAAVAEINSCCRFIPLQAEAP